MNQTLNYNPYIGDTMNKTVQQGTKVYHIEFGSGRVMSIKPRANPNNDLVWCYFPQNKISDWITMRTLLSNTGSITLDKPNSMSAMDETVSDPLQAALENLFGGKPPRM